MIDEMTRYFNWLVQRWDRRFHTLPRAPFDDGVEPSIYVGDPDDEGWIQWRPTRKTIAHDVGKAGQDFGFKLHPSLVEYWNTYWFCSLGGKYGGYGFSLFPVLPGKEIATYSSALEGYARAHSGNTTYTPIGSEKNGLLVVVRNQDGHVFLENYEVARFQDVAHKYCKPD